MESVHIFHPCLHEFLHVECRGVVVVVAIDGLIFVFPSAWRMGEACSEVIEVCDGLEADAMLRVYLSDLLCDDIVGVLHIDAF